MSQPPQQGGGGLPQGGEPVMRKRTMATGPAPNPNQQSGDPNGNPNPNNNRMCLLSFLCLNFCIEGFTFLAMFFAHIQLVI
jgi:hypothetical protein